ncbi:hypothetical protein [Lewinella sp. W8]|uniref:hypothetical protein n=1 Tax=Lewinella sp. W8 TaxID=2528208 RepID=UPI0010672687|nr:hypothetical protein [Lewinella sp. W8]MTB52113.1 hypothetical protein [Lewinella sp. W8]
MTFTLFPILDWMADLYAQPISRDRFKAYLEKLQGSSRGDLEVPIMAYNPMARAHVAESLEALRALDAEAIVRRAVGGLALLPEVEVEVRVVINLADDVGGGWTNRYATDYAATFRTSALVKRRFCTPHFWTSETYSPALIEERAVAAAARFAYGYAHGQPVSLRQHLEQEQYVAGVAGLEGGELPPAVARHAEAHQDSEDHALIFNFFYGDEASDSLGYRTFGMPAFAGFRYAAQLAG